MILGEKVKLKVYRMIPITQIHKILHAHDLFCVFIMNY
jgi:hypothetical protein